MPDLGSVGRGCHPDREQDLVHRDASVSVAEVNDAAGSLTMRPARPGPSCPSSIEDKELNLNRLKPLAPFINQEGELIMAESWSEMAFACVLLVEDDSLQSVDGFELRCASQLDRPDLPSRVVAGKTDLQRASTQPPSFEATSELQFSHKARSSRATPSLAPSLSTRLMQASRPRLPGPSPSSYGGQPSAASSSQLQQRQQQLYPSLPALSGSMAVGFASSSASTLVPQQQQGEHEDPTYGPLKRAADVVGDRLGRDVSLVGELGEGLQGASLLIQ